MIDDVQRHAMQRVTEYLALEERLGDEVRITEEELVRVGAAAVVRESGHVCAVCGADPTAPDAEPAAWGIGLDPDDEHRVLAILCPPHRLDDDE